MNAVLDANILIDYLQGHRAAKHELNRYSPPSSPVSLTRSSRPRHQLYWGTSKNEDFSVRARKPQYMWKYEDLSTQLMPSSRKRTVFRGADLIMKERSPTWVRRAQQSPLAQSSRWHWPPAHGGDQAWSEYHRSGPRQIQPPTIVECLSRES